MDEKTNEIKHVKPLMANIDIEGAVLTADALHTQTDFANYLVEEKKANYLSTVKDNQPTLLEDIKSLELKKKLQLPTGCLYHKQRTPADRNSSNLGNQ